MMGNNDRCYDSNCPYCSSRPDTTPARLSFRDKTGRREKRVGRRESRRTKSRLGGNSAGPDQPKLRLRLSSHQPLYHTHGNLTSNAAAGLLAVTDQGFNGHPVTDRMPIHFNSLLAAPEAHPSPSKPPRTVPVTNTCSLPTWQRYAAQFRIKVSWDILLIAMVI